MIIHSFLAITLVLLGMFVGSPMLKAQEESEGKTVSINSPADFQPQKSLRIDGSSVEERMKAYLKACTETEIPTTDVAKGTMPYLAARIYAGVDRDASVKRWQQLAETVFRNAKARLTEHHEDPHARDPFEKHALIHSYLACREKAEIPPQIADAIKQYVALYRHKQWIGYGALNYRLMNDGAGFLASELWPDLVDADGLNANQIKEVTRQRLFGYFDQIVRRNNDEYGAPTYLGIDLSAIKMLADYAQDPDMRNRAALTLDSMMLQVACAWNSGYHVTPASRSKYWGTSMTGPDSPDATAAIAWLYFGGKRPVNPGGMNPPGSIWFALQKSYAPPAIFADIAVDRSLPVIHRGSVGEKIRFTIYHTPGYSLASEWEFLPGPTDAHYKESRRQMLKWVSEHPDSTFIPMQENPRRPYRLQEGIPNAFGYGENPFSQSLQHDGTLIGIISVPEEYPFWRPYAPFTTRGAILKKFEKDGWVFCHGGSVLFAFRYAKPSLWDKPRIKEKCEILRSDFRKNAWILETSPVTPFAGGGTDAELKRFAAEVFSKTKFDASLLEGSHPSLSYRSLDGHLLEITYRNHGEAYSGQHRIDGVAVDYASFPLFGNPWAAQSLGSTSLTLQHGTESLTYDFGAWSRSPKEALIKSHEGR